MQKIIKITIIFLLIFILGIFFLSLNKSSNYNTESLVGNKLGEIELVSFEDDSIFTNDDFKKNSFTLINFWASWCAPCRIEHPQLMELSKENNIKILGVNFKDKKINALKFLKDLGDPYEYLTRDSNGKQSVNFGIYGIPESILIDNKLTIIKKFVGPLTKQDLNNIKEIINNL
jgi:cytochrome c biogenesis protein CcmG/thiol:disulfide interchange protein DsbE|tara:strand:- start:2045 stop:2566 length:522 start_codon:yes stop_codon:yes gene_type:complete